MDDDQVMEGMEQQDAAEPEGQEGAAPPAAEDGGFDLEEMPLFGDPDMEPQDETEAEGQEEQEEVPEGREDGEPPGDAPQTVEIGGQPVPVEELVQAADFGRQAAREVVELREQAGILDEFARLAGMDRDAYVGMLRGQLEQARLQREAENMGVTPEVARQMVETREREQAAREALERQQQAQLAEQQRQARLQPYLELIHRYPQLQDPAKMPPEVARQIQQGAHPVIAYQDFMLRQRQAAEQVQEQRRAVRDKTPGSAAGVGEGQVDDALAAFMAEFND